MANPIPIQNLYYLLSYAWNSLDPEDSKRIEPTSINAPQDLLAKMLSISVKILLKRGLARSYVACEEDVAGVRGRIMISHTIARNLRSHGRTCCTFDDFLPDIPANRVILATLYTLTRTKDIELSLREELYRLTAYFNEVALVSLNCALCESVYLDNNTRYYRLAIDICTLVAYNLQPSEVAGRWKFDDFTRDEKQMNRLFEAFVRNFYKLEQQSFDVSADKIKWNLITDNKNADLCIPEMRTDIVLQNKTRKIIIDTKYYGTTMKTYFEKKSINSAHLYQITAYLHNQDNGLDTTHTATGILLYPQTGEALDLKYQYLSYALQIRTVNLNANWKKIHEELLEIVE